MKIILSGSTGFVGQEVLHQCISKHSITDIIVLVRRRLPESSTKDRRVKVILMTDFTSYPEHVLQDLAGAEACIWCLGGLSANRDIDVGYTMAAAKAFTDFLAPRLDDGKKFRFVYTSGLSAVRDPKKSLWVMPAMRHVRGEVENELVALTKQNPDVFEAIITRPGLIYAKGSGIKHLTLGLSQSWTIRVDEVAAVMIDFAVNGGESHNIVENDVLKAKGRALL